jgi:hypothetical protein
LPLVIVQYDSRGFLRGGTGDEYPIQAMAAQGFAVLSFNRPMWYGSLHKPKDQIEALKASINGWADRRSNLSSLKVIIDKLVNEGLVDANRVAITGRAMAHQLQLSLCRTRHFQLRLSTCCEAPSTLALAGEALHDFYVEIGYPTSLRKSGFWRRCLYGCTESTSCTNAYSGFIRRVPYGSYHISRTQGTWMANRNVCLS